MLRASVEKPAVDLTALRTYRLQRLRTQMIEADVALCVLLNPVSLRYAVDCREYSGFQSRIPTIYAFVPVEGPVVMHGCAHRDYQFVDDYRRPYGLNTFDGGFDLADLARQFAAQAKAFLEELQVSPGTRRVAVEMVNPSVTQAMLQAGLEPCDAESLVERAKSIKSAEEVACMRHSIAVAEHGMRVMQDALEAGVRETELWSIMLQVNAAHDGDWFDGRMLCSGPRTNPWLQEASERVIQDGELVAFDTDMVGPFGYCADLSRTWRCGEGPASAQQRDVYQRAHAEVQQNLTLLEPGRTFREFSERGLIQPDEYIARRYPCIAHGIGMSDEYPKIYYRHDWSNRGYDGTIEANMTLCVESYVGSEHGGEGVKLEEMALVTETGYELLTTYPFESGLL